MSTPVAGERHVEIERKFDVPIDAVLPDLSTVAGVARIRQDAPAHLDATYYDTDGLTLITGRIAVRRRTGGHDAGWHLKTTGAHGRIERHWPIDDEAPEQPPAGLIEAVSEWVDAATLRPVARIRTTRTATVLFDAHDRQLVEIADDQVHTDDLRDGTVRQWREWETELAERLDDQAGSPGALLLDRLQHRLARAGARPSSAVAKLQRALGLDPADQPSTRTAAQTVAHSLDEIAAALDPRVREAVADQPDAVHQARILVRRLRSLLDVFGSVFETAAVTRALHRLRAVGRDLGAVRDAEVRARYAEQQLRRLPEVPKTRRLVGRLAEPAWQAHDAAQRRLATQLDSGRLTRVHLSLAALDDTDRASAMGRRPAAEVLPDLLAEATARLIAHDADAVAIWRTLDEVGGEPAQLAAFEAALHLVRKDARALRYSYEAIAPEHPAVIAAAKALQDLLGDHRDDLLFADHVLAVAVTDRQARETQQAALPYYLLAEAARNRAAAALSDYAVTRDELLAEIAATGRSDAITASA